MRKYPGYRFAPVKKADREREREERATQGRTSRKTGSSSATTASSASPMTASTSATQLDPMMVSADPRYGPWGPSPPISAAASPEPGPWSDHQVDDQVQAAITSLPTPNTSQSPSSQTLFPPNNLPEQPSNSVPSLWQVTQQLPAPQSPITLPHTPTSMASWSNSNSFTMPDPVGSDVRDLTRLVCPFGLTFCLLVNRARVLRHWSNTRHVELGLSHRISIFDRRSVHFLHAWIQRGFTTATLWGNSGLCRKLRVARGF